MPKGLQGFQKGNKLGVGNTYRIGMKNSTQTRLRISKALKGKFPKNLSAINTNKTGSGNPMWGKHPSVELYAKIVTKILQIT